MGLDLGPIAPDDLRTQVGNYRRPHWLEESADA